MDDVFCRLMSLSSYIAHRFIQFIEDLLYGETYPLPEDYVWLSRAQYTNCTSQNDNQLISEPCTPHELHEESTSSHEEQVSVILRSGNLERRDGNNRVVNFICKGLRYVSRLALAFLRCSCYYIQCVEDKIQRFIYRLSKTLNGSSDEIGWLQRDPEMAPVTDGTARFLELLHMIRNGEHSLPYSFVYLLIPGLFSNHGPLYFVSTKKFFSQMGLACHIAKIHSEASVEHNAWELKQYIEELYWGSGKRVMLLGHSKGGVDASAALSLYWNDLKHKVAGLALVQSPYGGTPIASDILREGQFADKETRKVMEFIICKIIKGDIRALEDLTYEKRREFIKKHKLPENIPIISFHSEASVAPGVLATMSHIAHAELPWLPFARLSQENIEEVVQFPVIAPASAALAICSLHLQLRYGEKSDGLVTCRDAEVPGSVVVRPDRKLDHAWMVYSSWNKNNIEPDACQMCEALLTLLVQLGRKKKVEE